MAQHKIQSSLVQCGAAEGEGEGRGGGGDDDAGGGGGRMNLSLYAVPKLLGKVRESYLTSPRNMHVSFKLETDITLLRSKMRKAIESYGIDVVVGNLLSDYRVRALLAVNERTSLTTCRASATTANDGDKIGADGDMLIKALSLAAKGPRVGAMAEEPQPDSGGGVEELERIIVEEIVALHSLHIARKRATDSLK